MFLLPFSSASEPQAETAQLWIMYVFQKLFNTLKSQRDPWELNDSHVYHSAKYQLPIAKSAVSAMGHSDEVASDIAARNVSYVGSFYAAAIRQWPVQSLNPHHVMKKRLIFWHCNSQCTTATFIDLSIAVTQLMAIWFQQKMHVIDPTSLVWRLFYKLRAKCCDLTDELQ